MKSLVNLKEQFVKKFISVKEDVLKKLLADGKSIAGTLNIDKKTGAIYFNAWKRDMVTGECSEDQIIFLTEHGWIKVSKNRLKFFESIPKKIGISRIFDTLDREMKEALKALTGFDINKNN